LRSRHLRLPEGLLHDPTALECSSLPRELKHWSLTTLREKLIKIGAKVVSRSKSLTFQMAEVAVPRRLFAAILERIDPLRLVPGTG
jgi:hypothetical protein